MLAEQKSHLILAIWSIFTFPMMLLAQYLITLFWLGLWQAEIISHRLLKELLSEENTSNQETTSLGGPSKETRARGKTNQKVSSGSLKGFMLRSQKAATVSFQKQFLIITVHFKDCTDSVVLLNVAGRVLNVQYEKRCQNAQIRAAAGTANTIQWITCYWQNLVTSQWNACIPPIYTHVWGFQSLFEKLSLALKALFSGREQLE